MKRVPNGEAHQLTTWLRSEGKVSRSGGASLIAASQVMSVSLNLRVVRMASVACIARLQLNGES